ncbi:glucokinase [Azospirillum sp. RWY-5-1]|uniref:Glucokinase n=1 Tax=Azospirillum oleiclasticum TaxID=2735135 RepID=A0ABX2TMK1_9PROT|nr:glucokinase [Azospirillum oleiclasticum]NYZ17611.1 glucokinase [Azospirillum oleiclasticum]NYZ24921.1 glucokinase [Azospirillum oleiclasticum]
MTDPRPTLVADIGATNARFGLMDGNHLRETRTLRGADYPTIEAAAEAFLAAAGVGRLRPVRAAFAVAGPVTGDRVALTNLPWAFSVDAVRLALGLDRLVVINDFTAVAMSVPRLGPDDVRAVGDGVADPAGVVGVLGPGSGLGVSGLVPAAGGGWTALSGEGGHVTMAPVGDREGAILAQLRKSFDHVSAERVLSGPGLVNLYQALRVLDGREPETLRPADVTARAMDRSDAQCVEAVETFCAMLGTVAGNLALTLGSRGGVYIAGGIVPKLGPIFLHSRFRKRFVEKGRMRDFLNPIPTLVIAHPLPAFLGLVEVLERG